VDFDVRQKMITMKQLSSHLLSFGVIASIVSALFLGFILIRITPPSLTANLNLDHERARCGAYTVIADFTFIAAACYLAGFLGTWKQSSIAKRWTSGIGLLAATGLAFTWFLFAGFCGG